jgi:cytochrome oxidase Cu insertion factor (SCO1/SenC/PrrC family)
MNGIWRYGLFALLFFATTALAEQPRVRETRVIDQDGRQLEFYKDLVKGRTVAINFIFTSCTAVCPMLAANFRKMQGDLANQDADVRLISISVDPTTDTPERLKRFAEQYRAGPNWTLVTGDKGEIDALLGSLGNSARDKMEHTPTVLIGNEAAGYWQRVDGLASTEVVLRALREAAARRAEISAPESPAAAQSAKYFPNLELVTQDGVKVRFYDDVLKGKTVLVSFLFTSCADVCPPMTANLARVQRLLGDRLGRDIVMVSISLDPETDTPDALKAYAEKFGAKTGWYFLTGSKANVDGVLAKLGGYVDDKNKHSAALLIGNVPRGGWQKMFAMGKPEAIASVAIDIAR